MTDTPPQIISRDELITREDLASQLGVHVRTVDGWRYGVGGVPLPYLRFAGRIWTWEGAVVWFLNQYAAKPDTYYIDVMRKRKERKNGRRRH